MTSEKQIEQSLITKLTDLKYIYRPDIRDRDALTGNFRDKFEARNDEILGLWSDNEAAENVDAWVREKREGKCKDNLLYWRFDDVNKIE